MVGWYQEEPEQTHGRPKQAAVDREVLENIKISSCTRTLFFLRVNLHQDR
jgi:hypothetical protein